MTRRNPVAKHANTFNRAATHRDRKKDMYKDIDNDEYEFEECLEEEDFVECPYCGTDQYRGQAHLGGLGNLNHYRCRHCGGQWENAS